MQSFVDELCSETKKEKPIVELISFDKKTEMCDFV